MPRQNRTMHGCVQGGVYVVANIPNINDDEDQPRGHPELRFTRKYREVLSFLFDLGHEATNEMFYELYAVARPASKNEYGKMVGTLARMERCGLLDRLSKPWHNGTTWVLTDLGATWGQKFSAEFEYVRVFLQRKEQVLLDHPFRPPHARVQPGSRRTQVIRSKKPQVIRSKKSQVIRSKKPQVIRSKKPQVINGNKQIGFSSRKTKDVTP